MLVTSREHRTAPRSSRSRWSSCSEIKQGAAVAGIDSRRRVRRHASTTARSSTDTGWKILLGRGLDIFQYVANDAFDLAAKLQQYRQVKAFGVTYIRGECPTNGVSGLKC